jgi:hypothetical protein
MKKLVILIFSALLTTGAWANTSAISFSAEQSNHTLLVYVNGKLIQSHKKKYVRQRSMPGFHVVKIKVYNQKGKVLQTITQRVYIKSGFENNYRVDVLANKSSVKRMPLYPLYSNFFYNPALYTRNSIIA